MRLGDGRRRGDDRAGLDLARLDDLGDALDDRAGDAVGEILEVQNLPSLDLERVMVAIAVDEGDDLDRIQLELALNVIRDLDLEDVPVAHAESAERVFVVGEPADVVEREGAEGKRVALLRVPRLEVFAPEDVTVSAHRQFPSSLSL